MARGGGGGDEDEPSESVSGIFGSFPLLNKDTYEEQPDCNHSKARNFKEERKGKMMHIGVWNTNCKTAV